MKGDEKVMKRHENQWKVMKGNKTLMKRNENL